MRAPSAPARFVEDNAAFGRGLARAFAGATIFGLPLFMTMEMWSLGEYVPSWKVALLLVLFFPLLVALSWHAGFERTFRWRDDVVDALVAYAVGFTTSALALWLIGALNAETAWRGALGQVSLQAVPASIGALLAQSQLGERQAGQPQRGGVARYGSDLFIMAIGALFLSFNLAPTEEMLLIAMRIGPARAMLLVAVSLAAMHAFVYGAEFRSRPHPGAPASATLLFLRFTVVGYATCLVLSAWMLWTFGRLEGLPLAAAVQVTVVLGFPAAVGAASARLIL
ncbi:TIGR02587 family membrane protein [Ramlibacter sp. AN1015]|uniref:TIGR02587 family membrane protein n=1 Tax=Ramlibacter sp. AN1015 TaxID=3133428 RepID=UPI0030BE2A7D